jgi:AraC-like DNA-binding protein
VSKIADFLAGAPAPQLGPLVSSYGEIRYEGFPPGTHLGLPSRHLTVVFALEAPLRLAASLDRPRTGSFTALVAGFHTTAVAIEHEGRQSAISLELTPAGARSLLGVPASELVGTVVHLEDLLGPESRELPERLAEAPAWRGCFAVLDEVLIRRVGQIGEAERSMSRAWERIVASGGAISVGDLANELGYSRRHLTDRFAREYGLTPKPAARVVRFERSWSLLRHRERSLPTARPKRPSLATVAVLCGYYDQAHMVREWNELAGCPPSTWLAAEELPFVQDTGPEGTVRSSA